MEKLCGIKLLLYSNLNYHLLPPFRAFHRRHIILLWMKIYLSEWNEWIQLNRTKSICICQTEPNPTHRKETRNILFKFMVSRKYFAFFMNLQRISNWNENITYFFLFVWVLVLLGFQQATNQLCCLSASQPACLLSTTSSYPKVKVICKTVALNRQNLNILTDFTYCCCVRCVSVYSYN